MKTIFKLSPLLILLGIFVGAWLKWQWILVNWIKVPLDPLDLLLRGQYGDSYGSLNALFAGVALLGVVYTLISQTREEANRETEQAKRDKQRTLDEFEINFFRLVDIWRDYVRDLSNERKKGILYIEALWDSFLERQLESNTSFTLPVYALKYTAFFFERATTPLAPYFRILFHIFKFLHDAPILDRKRYSNIVRALLSPSELLFLAVNCETEHGQPFKEFVIEFDLVKHMPEEISAYRNINLPLRQLKMSLRNPEYVKMESNARD